MNNQTFWIGFVVVFIIMQATGYLVHEVWLADAYEALASVFRPEAEMFDMMWMMTVGGVVTLFLFCYIFTKGREGAGAMQGAKYGTLIGLLMSTPMAINQYVVYPLPANLAAIWFITSLASFIVAGAVFATIYKPSA